MDVAVVLAVSVLLQLAAALVALRLIWLTGAGRAWVLIASAVFLMAVRRSITLFELIARGFSEPPSLSAELVALVISVLMLAGIAWIGPQFRSIRKSETDLRESERKLSTLMANLPGMAYRCRNDADWTMEFVSNGSLELTGYRPDELIGNRVRSYNELIHRDHRQAVWDQVQQGLANREPFRLVYRICTSENREKWVWEQGVGVFSETGELLALEGFITDVTERRQVEDMLRDARAELERRVEIRTMELAQANQRLKREIAEREQADEALRESEQRFRSLVETTSDWIWAVDQNDAYTYASPKVKDLTGYEPDDVLGKTPSGFMPPEEAAQQADLFRQFAAQGKPFVRVENTICHKDGRRVILERSGVPIFDGDGTLRGYRGVDRDITKPKEDEARLKRTLAELERSNRDLQQFAYSASHDLQEPLRMLHSFLDTLQTRSGDALDKNAAALVESSLHAVGRMQQLINDLLAYARVGTRRKRFEVLDCNTVVDQVIGDLRAAIETNAARVTRDDLPSVEADPTLLSQLFQNLIGNAVKFHDQAPPHVHVASQRLAGVWQFAVADNGIGIDPGAAERIFEVFERLGPAEQYAGTGIGLAICKRVVERHGGRIWCEPRSQGGTTFYFTIPAAGATREPAESP